MSLFYSWDDYVPLDFPKHNLQLDVLRGWGNLAGNQPRTGVTAAQLRLPVKVTVNSTPGTKI